MKGQKNLLVALFAVVLISSDAFAQQVAITGATIIDGTGKAPLSDGVVLINDGRITAVGRSGDVAIPNGARSIDARGKFVIPGLMDANNAVFDVSLENLIKYEGRYHELILEAAQIALKNGLTSFFTMWRSLAPAIKARDPQVRCLRPSWALHHVLTAGAEGDRGRGPPSR